MIKSKTNRMKSPRSVAFLNPDYHCSFFLQSELSRRGWTAKILVLPGYPSHLLYSKAGIVDLRHRRFLTSVLRLRRLETVAAMVSGFILRFRIVYELRGVRYVVVYGNPPQGALDLLLEKLLSRQMGFNLLLNMLTRLHKKIVFVPSGCHEEELRSEFEKFDDGNVCGNCGYADRCNDDRSKLRIAVINRYANGSLMVDPFVPKMLGKVDHIRYKSLDLDEFSPWVAVPDELHLPTSSAFRVFHATSLDGRRWEGRNIKGSPFVHQAVEELRAEGLNIELVSPKRVASEQMKFIQVQCDVVVDQLIYGWLGSTGIEALGLGRPLICYIRPSWQRFFENAFSGNSEFPVINATAFTIKETLKKLYHDRELLNDVAAKSRSFAESHLDVKRNVKEFEEYLLSL